MTVPLLTRGYVTGNVSAPAPIVQVPLTPQQIQAVLQKSLVLEPSGDVPDDVYGIHQSDVVIRAAIVQALVDLRAKPYLLDHVFSSLPRDPNTAKDYGQKDVDKAKAWFLKTEIPVSMVPRIDEGRWPRITISLSDSSESENTLGDVHYQPVAFVDSTSWPALTSRFAIVAYTPHTGQLTLPDMPITIEAGMFIVDNTGQEHPIIDLDSNTVVYIAKNTIADFRNAIIKGVKPRTSIALESATFRETYQIGVHVGQEPVYLTWLHSIVVFALLRYRQSLLEARGFERSSFSSSDFVRNTDSDGELIFTRMINLTGIVRQYWPKVIASTISGVDSVVAVNPAHHLPTNKANDVTVADALWVGELDVDSVG